MLAVWELSTNPLVPIFFIFMHILCILNPVHEKRFEFAFFLVISFGISSGFLKEFQPRFFQELRLGFLQIIVPVFLQELLLGVSETLSDILPQVLFEIPADLSEISSKFISGETVEETPGGILGRVTALLQISNVISGAILRKKIYNKECRSSCRNLRRNL